MTTEKLHKFAVPDLPQGWRAVACRVPKKGESILTIHGTITTVTNEGWTELRLIVEKIKPRRIVLEETDESPRRAEPGEYYFDDYGIIRASGRTSNNYKIWREVKEEE